MAKIPRKLAHIPLFREIGEQALQEIEAACAWREVAASDWAIRRGASETDVYIVLHGQLRVIASAAGTKTILRDLGPGDFFGEIAALDGQTRSAGILALTDATLACLPAAAFRHALHRHPSICDHILLVLVRQIRLLSDRANETAGLSMKHRLWSELLRLAAPVRAQPNTWIISPPPTHAELAARIAGHREGVTRELVAMERAGLIERRRGAIQLLDPAGMRRIVAETTEDEFTIV